MLTRKLALITALSITAISSVAFAFEVRAYNDESKTFKGTFNCHGTKTDTEIRPGTTSLSTNADGPCTLTLEDGRSVTVDKGDKISLKNGQLSKL